MNSLSVTITRSVTVLLGFALLFFFFQDETLLFSSNHFGFSSNLKEFPVFLFFNIYTLFWFVFMPAITNKLIYRENLKEIGLVLPEKKWLACVLILIALSLMLPYIIYFSTLTSFQGYKLESNIQQFIMMVALFPLYYISEEFFFRGFIFLGLWKRVGWHSFWITDILFTLSHLGKPWPEVLLCIPASVVFNILTLCTRSVFPAVAVHTTMGIVLSFLVTFKG